MPHCLFARLARPSIGQGGEKRRKTPTDSVRVQTPKTVRYNTRFHQLDVESAYATAYCTREIYTYYSQGKGPPGIQTSARVLRLRKAFNGVIDAGRNFYEEWVDYHIQLGFQSISTVAT